MANIYVRSTDGVNTDDGSTWALAKLDLAGAAAIDAAGDTISVSQSHAESTATSIVIALAGTATSPTKIICCDDSADPPTAVSTAASVTTTGNASITITGAAYVYGLPFSCGSSGQAPTINLNSAVSLPQRYEECQFKLASVHTSQRINVGLSANANGSAQNWINCDVKFAQAGQTIIPHCVKWHWRGGSLLAGGTSPTSLLALTTTSLGRSSDVLIDGVDFSAAAAGINLVGTMDAGSHIIFRNITLPASWSGALLLTAVPGNRVELHNGDSADTNYRLWIADYAGSIKSETTLVKTGGASDGVVPFSLKMTTSANASYPTVPLESCELPALWNDVVGSPVTVTVDVLHDSATNLTDADIWLEVQYLGTSGFPLSSFITDAKADVLATAADQTASTATWTTTGMANPNKQKLSVTFTPQEAGFLQSKVVLAKASTTAYVDAKQQVS